MANHTTNNNVNNINNVVELNGNQYPLVALNVQCTNTTDGGIPLAVGDIVLISKEAFEGIAPRSFTAGGETRTFDAIETSNGIMSVKTFIRNGNGLGLEQYSSVKEKVDALYSASLIAPLRLVVVSIRTRMYGNSTASYYQFKFA